MRGRGRKGEVGTSKTHKEQTHAEERRETRAGKRRGRSKGTERKYCKEGRILYLLCGAPRAPNTQVL